MKQKLQKGDSVPFTQIANDVLNDSFLSYKAKGLFAYLYSKEDRYDFAAKRIAKDSSDGMDSVLSGLQELEVSGYLRRNRLKSGRVYYEITYTKTAKPLKGKKPNRENPNEGKSLDGKIPSLSNIEGAPKNIDTKQTSFSTKKERRKYLLERMNSLFGEKWDSYSDDRTVLFDKCRVSLVQGGKLFSLLPTLISDYMSNQEAIKSPWNWKSKQDFLITVKNLALPIINAEVDCVSVSSWSEALSKTDMMDMATINTVIKSL